MPVQLKAQGTATCTKLLWHLVPKASLQPQLSWEAETEAPSAHVCSLPTAPAALQSLSSGNVNDV